jgi:Tol biopolymer transport system component
MIGQTISHYKILEKLGEGGMGVVYKAEDTKLKRTVALKFLPPELTRDEEAKERFVHEAQAASALEHNNICNIHEIAETDDSQLFICMAYYEGETLKKRIETGPMMIEEALDVAIQVASGLTKAHDSGIVHRDTKPANVIITKDGVAKILDFGLAKLGGRTLLTKSGTTLGTVAYMSPEQARGEMADHRADIWSLGVVMYEMLTGQRPFRGEYEQAVIYSLLNVEPEPVTSLRTGVPLELEIVIKKCLEKDASNRYQRADEVLADLRRVKGETSKVTPSRTAAPRLAREVRKKRKTRSMVYVGAAAILIVAAVALYLLLRPAGVRVNPNYTIRTLYTRSYQTAMQMLLGPMFMYPGISRDGNWVTFGAPDDSGRWNLYFMNVSYREPRKIPLHEAAWLGAARISPNGDLILFGGQATPLRVVSSSGEEVRNVVDNVFGGDWCPDGSRISYVALGGATGSQRWEIWSTQKDGTEKRLEWADSVTQREAFFAIAHCWSPGGESIGWIRDFPQGYSELFTVNLKTGRERQLTFDKKIADEPAWMSNGNIVFMSNRSGVQSIWAIPAEGGEPRQIVGGGTEQPGVRVSGDGKRLLIPEVDAVTDMWATDLAGVNAPQIRPGHFAPWWGFAASGDMQRFAFARNEQSEGWALYVTDHEGKNPVRLVVSKHGSVSPAFSPDGKWIAYLELEKNSENVSLVESDRPGAPRTATVPHLGYNSFVRWIDSQNFVVNNGDLKTYVCSVSRAEPKQLFEDSTWATPILGGKYVVYQDYRNGREGRWIVPLDWRGKATGQAIKFLSSEALAVSSPDSRIWIYEKHPGQLWKITLPERKEELAGRLPPVAKLYSVRFSNDGKRLAYLVDRVTLKLVLLENVFE